MNKELSINIPGAISFTKLYLPNSRSLAGDEEVDPFNFAAFLHILLNITNYHHNEESKSVFG